MKLINVLICSLFVAASFYCSAQTSLYQEGFEGIPSVVGGGSPGWSFNSTFFQSGTNSFFVNGLNPGDSSALTTSAFSTTGHSFVMLEFSHICKIEFFDAAEIFISNDNGATWVKLTAGQYMGTGIFTSISGNKFTSSAYPDWLPGTNSVPTNQWWKVEYFDISALAANSAQVKLRFCVKDMNYQTIFENWGWILDDIKVTGAISELFPPLISLNSPIYSDTITSTGPFDINATITDTSGIALAKLVYYVNSGNTDTLIMVNTSGNNWIATIPSFSYTNKINYRILAVDSSLSANIGYSPWNWFFVKEMLIHEIIVSKTANVVQSGGGINNYGPLNYNDGIISSGSSPFGWVATNGWIEYIWDSPVSIKKIKFWKGDRQMDSCFVQKWDGVNYVNISNYSGTATEDSVVLSTPQTTSRLRFTQIAGVSNPNFREIEVFAFDSAFYWSFDAGITQIVEPLIFNNSLASYPVKVRMKNYAKDTLSKALINWSVDGVIQPAFLWNGILLKDQISPVITVGSFAFSTAPHDLQVWTSQPNDSLDENHVNDTLRRRIHIGSNQLNGIYTIGEAGDFLTPQSALTALQQNGISGPVIFNIETGVYEGQLIVPLINGVSAVNTVTFQSANADSTSVVFLVKSDSVSFVIRLNGSKHFKFHNLTTKITGSGSGNIIELTGGSSFNEISNCFIEMPANTNKGYKGIYCSGSFADNINVIKTNRIVNGTDGIHLIGTPTSRKNGYVIKDNTIEGFRSYGMRFAYMDSTLIENNTIKAKEKGTLIMYGISIYDLSNSCIVRTNKISASDMSTTCYGIYLSSSQNGVELSGNDIELKSTSDATGIFVLSCNDGLIIKNNRIVCTSKTSLKGMYFHTCSGTAATRTMIYNNMISQIGEVGSQVFGIQLININYFNFYFNTVNIAGEGSDNVAFDVSYGGNMIELKNNSISNFGQGAAMKNTTPSALSIMDYNNYFSKGPNLGYWGSTGIASLAAWKTATLKDYHSISVDPLFISLNDLHANSPFINDAGTIISNINTDFDGNPRGAFPDIGADEFNPVVTDVGIVEITSPLFACPGDTVPIKLLIRNIGIDTVFSLIVQWSVNNISQPPLILFDTIQNGENIEIQVGTYVFYPGINYNLFFNTTQPNNLPDGRHQNDTLRINNFRSALLAGTYSVGGYGSDYQSVNSAVDQLVRGGVCGPVIFELTPGVYDEQVTIGYVKGTSITNTVTFRSLSGKSNSVVLTANGQDGWHVLQLFGSSHINISDMTIKTSNPIQSYGVLLSGDANRNEISSCILEATVNSLGSIPLYSPSGSNTNLNVIKNNWILYGAYGVNFIGNDSGNIITDNEITDPYIYGIYLFSSLNTQISKNSIHKQLNFNGLTSAIHLWSCKQTAIENNNISISGNPKVHGIYSSFSQSCMISGNRISLSGSGNHYGLYFDNENALPASSISKITNNFIYQEGNFCDSAFGIYLSNSNNLEFIYNSVNLTLVNPGLKTINFVAKNGTNNKLINNIFCNTCGGYTIFVSSPSCIVQSDHNDLFTTGSYIGYWGSAIQSLSNWKSITGKDINSVSVDPQFVSSTDLHIAGNPGLSGIGAPISSVTEDIDGDLRDSLAPDIGADEFSLDFTDISLSGFGNQTKQYGIQGSLIPVEIQFINLGSTTINSLNIGYIVGSGQPVINNWTGSLAQNDTGNYIFNIPAGLLPGPHPITVFISCPADSFLNNDTLVLSYFVMTIVTPNWSDNFDSASSVWFSDGSLWQKGVPSGQIVNTAHSAVQVWKTNLTGSYSNNASEYLYSPFFDLSSYSLLDTVAIDFWHWIDVDPGNDFCQLQITIDTGINWSTLGFYQDSSGINWYNMLQNGVPMFSAINTGWYHSKIKLDPAIFNQSIPVQFRFCFSSDASVNSFDGWAIDDFNIGLVNANDDVGIQAIINPCCDTAIASMVYVDIVIKNYGFNQQTSIPLILKIGNDTLAIETWYGNLQKHTTTTYSFLTPFVVPLTPYVLCVETNLLDDTVAQNNAKCMQFYPLPAHNDVGALSIIEPTSDSIGEICSYDATAHPWYKYNIIVRIMNYGQNVQSSVPVKYSLFNTGQVFYETLTGNIMSYNYNDFSLNTQFLPFLGPQEVCVETQLSGDPVISNNKICKNYIGRTCLGINEFANTALDLMQNTPNPASGITTVPYVIPEAGSVIIGLMDILGQVIYSVHNISPAGKNQTEINISSFPAGVYYYYIEYNGNKVIKKLIIN